MLFSAATIFLFSQNIIAENGTKKKKKIRPGAGGDLDVNQDLVIWTWD